MKQINDHYAWQLKHPQTIQHNREVTNKSYVEFRKKVI